jgi:predicted dehydrogenase
MSAEPLTVPLDAAVPVDVQNRPLRAGIIGLGAGRAHMRGYQQAAGVDVFALAGKETERLAELAAIYGAERTYTDWEDLVADPDVDVVSVATPNSLHAPITIAALGAGKHVLCEKPLSVEAGSAADMVHAAVEAGRVLEVAFNFRRRGDVRVLKGYIDEGKLGKVYHAKASWIRRRGIPGIGSWFASKEMAGGGPLIDLGVHVLDLALYLMGEPKVISVTANTYSELGHRGIGGYNSRRFGNDLPFDVEDLATAFLRFENGSTLLLEAAWAANQHRKEDIEIELMGVDGGADIWVKQYADENTLRIFTDVGGRPAVLNPTTPKSLGHRGVVADFVEVVRGGNWSAHTGLDGLRRTQIIDACYASAREGREVRLDAT